MKESDDINVARITILTLLGTRGHFRGDYLMSFLTKEFHQKAGKNVENMLRVSKNAIDTALSELCRDGFISSQGASRGIRYSITATGREELRRAIATVSAPRYAPRLAISKPVIDKIVEIAAGELGLDPAKVDKLRAALQRATKESALR